MCLVSVNIFGALRQLVNIKRESFAVKANLLSRERSVSAVKCSATISMQLAIFEYLFSFHTASRWGSVSLHSLKNALIELKILRKCLERPINGKSCLNRANKRI